MQIESKEESSWCVPLKKIWLLIFTDKCVLYVHLEQAGVTGNIFIKDAIGFTTKAEL